MRKTVLSDPEGNQFAAVGSVAKLWYARFVASLDKTSHIYIYRYIRYGYIYILCVFLCLLPPTSGLPIDVGEIGILGPAKLQDLRLAD